MKWKIFIVFEITINIDIKVNLSIFSKKNFDITFFKFISSKLLLLFLSFINIS